MFYAGVKGGGKAMRRLLIVVALLALLPQLVCAAEVKHLSEIDRLSRLISEKNFDPIEVKTEGKNFKEALVMAAEVVRDHVGLRSLSPEICKCLKNTNLIPLEECALLKNWDYTLTEKTVGQEKRVSLLIKLNSRHLKQIALFELWPLYGQEFVKKVST
jgi:hypothetical protein